MILGNFAISRGLLEAGLELISAYPGTPSSEILPGVVYFAKREGWDIYAEWSVNEKVALELSFGASLEGLSSACAMKQVGFNVALPSFIGLMGMDIPGALVLCIADDPGPISSQTEQDTRMLMSLLGIPVFDPSSVDEARRFSRYAMILSRMTGIPVCIRPTSRISHMREAIELDERVSSNIDRVKDGRSVEALREIISAFDGVNTFIEGDGDTALVASGMSFSTALDVLRELELSIPLFKVGSPYPFPDELAARSLKDVKRIVVLEETDSVLEMNIFRLFPGREIYGRRSGHVPSEGELSYDVVRDVISTVFGIERGARVYVELKEAIDSLGLPKRPPRLCPGCGHRGAFASMRLAFKDKGIYPGDIGCYTLGTRVGAVDTFVDMGASVNVASGFSQAKAQDGLDIPIVATIGDSTFFHSGLPALYGAKERGYPFILLILDNMSVAMTGFQPTPETGETALGLEGNKVSLESVLFGLGFDAKVVDPYDVEGLSNLLKDLWDRGEISVVVARRPCALRYGKDVGEKRPYITEECTGCGLCLKLTDCPALIVQDDGRVSVDLTLCNGCGVCRYVCPVLRKKEKPLEG